MTVIRMNTDDVHTAAYQVDWAAGELYLKPSRLRSAAGSLTSVWEGGRASHYAAELRRLANLLHNEVINLQRLASRLRSELAEWENADGTLGKVGLATVAWSSLGLALYGKTPRWIAERLNDLRGIGEKARLFSKVGVGKSYPGQLIFKGSKHSDDVAGALTHIKKGNLAKHMLRHGKIGVIDKALAAWEVWERGSQDVGKYDTLGQQVSVVKVDAAFVVAKTLLSHKAGLVAAGAAISFVAGLGVIATAPAWVAGAAIVGAGVIAWWGASAITGAAMDGAFHLAETSGVKDAYVRADAAPLDNAISAGRSLVNFVDRAFGNVMQGLRPAPQP